MKTISYLFISLFSVVLTLLVVSYSGLALPLVGPTNLPSDLNADEAKNAIDVAFGTIQFSITVLSGMVIIFAIVISVFVGRTMRDSQAAARSEIEKFADLYRDNLKSFDETLDIRAAEAVNQKLQAEDLAELLNSYRLNLTEVERIRTEISPLLSDYRDFEKARKERDSDYAGPFINIRDKVRAFEDEDDASRFRSENRQAIRSALLLMERGALRRRVPADEAFNGAQEASTNDFAELAHRLAVCAEWLHPTQIHTARVCRAEYERGDRIVIVGTDEPGVFDLESANPENDKNESDRIRQEAYKKLLRMMGRYDDVQYHLIYSEIWNAAVESGSLDEFISEGERIINEGEQEGKHNRAYIYTRIARAYTLSSPPGWQDRVKALLDKGEALWLKESVGSPPHRHVYMDIEHCRRVLAAAE